TVLFSTVSTMQFSATVATPQPGDPHDTYREFDLALRRVVVHALAEAMKEAITAPPLTLVETGPNSQLLVMLTDVLGQIEVSDDFQKTKYAAALKLVEYLGQADAMESELRLLEREDAEGLLGRRFDTYEQIDAALEAFV